MAAVSGIWCYTGMWGVRGWEMGRGEDVRPAPGLDSWVGGSALQGVGSDMCEEGGFGSC